MVKRLRSNPNPVRSQKWEISCVLGKVSLAKTLLFRPLKLNRVRESAFFSASKVAHWLPIRPLWTGVKPSHRVTSVSSHLGIATYKYAAPAIIEWWLLPEYSLTVKRESTPPKPNPPKHKSYWSELIHYDLGTSLLALLSWRTAILLDG